MTYEREAIDCLARCRFAPGTFDKRFSRDMQAKVKNEERLSLSPKQRETLWRIAWRYRKQILLASKAESTPMLEHARWWLDRPVEVVAFETPLDVEPKDDEARLIYADWLEERGDPLSAAHRYIVEHSAYPDLFPQWWGYWGEVPVEGCERGFGHEWTIGKWLGAPRYEWDPIWKWLGFARWHKSREGAERALAEALVIQAKATRKKSPTLFKR